MRPPPSENFRNMASPFHSMSVGGRFCGLLKKISYSIFSRRSCESSTFSSSSMVTGLSKASVSGELPQSEVPIGHGGECTKVSWVHRLSAVSYQLKRDFCWRLPSLNMPIRKKL